MNSCWTHRKSRRPNPSWCTDTAVRRWALPARCQSGHLSPTDHTHRHTEIRLSHRSTLGHKMAVSNQLLSRDLSKEFKFAQKLSHRDRQNLKKNNTPHVGRAEPTKKTSRHEYTGWPKKVSHYQEIVLKTVSEAWYVTNFEYKMSTIIS